MPKSKNPAELVIFGNPRRSRGRRNAKDRVETVQLRTASGKPIRKVSRVHLADGRTVTFTEKTSKRKAIAQARGMKNPEELTQAVELYETFQGKRAENIVEAQRSAAMRTDYAALGSLLAIGLNVEHLKIPSPDHWEDYPHLKFAKDVVLASNAEGSQLYAIGGDQDVSAAAEKIPGVDTSKDLLDLGAIAFIVYFARKSVDNFQPIEYMHQFDEPRPSIGFDQVKREIFFIGGRYTVEAPGITH